MQKQDRRVRRTRKAIKTAFIELFEVKPLTKITVTELTRLADIDRRTFYLHYRNTDEIIQEIEADLAANVAEALKNLDGFDIRDFFECLVATMEDDMDYYRRISKEPSYYRFQLRCKDVFKAALKDARFVTSGLSAEEFDIYSEYVGDGIMGIYTHWLREETGMSVERLTELAIEAVSVGWERITKVQ